MKNRLDLAQPSASESLKELIFIQVVNDVEVSQVAVFIRWA